MNSRQRLQQFARVLMEDDPDSLLAQDIRGLLDKWCSVQLCQTFECELPAGHAGPHYVRVGGDVEIKW